DRIKALLKNYSLSTHIFERLWSFVDSGRAASPNDSFYNYADPEASANKLAIERFARDVCSSGARFALIVLSDSEHLAFPDYFQGLDDFLKDRGIFSVDLHQMFSNRGLKYSDFSQIDDPHYSVIGNHYVADALYGLMQNYGDKFGSCKNLAR